MYCRACDLFVPIGDRCISCGRTEADVVARPDALGPFTRCLAHIGEIEPCGTCAGYIAGGL